MICVNSVSVTPSSVTLKAGEWYYSAKATVCPVNADCKSVRWHSDNTNVATVNTSSGYIYAKAAGTAKIYATAIDGSGKSDCITVTVSSTVSVTSVTLNKGSISLEKGSGVRDACVITVEEIHAESIEMCPESVTIGVDETAVLRVSLCPENTTDEVMWSSSNSNIARVNNGVVTGVSGGACNIVAKTSDTCLYILV